TGTGTGAADSLVSFGLVDGPSDIDRTGSWDIRLPALRPQRDLRGIRVIAVLLFQRLLKRSKIHCDLVRYVSWRLSGDRDSFGQVLVQFDKEASQACDIASQRTRRLAPLAQIALDCAQARLSRRKERLLQDDKSNCTTTFGPSRLEAAPSAC